MLYPTIKQYLDAIRLAEDNFDQLAAYRLVTGADGNAVMSSGNFAVVFKMQDTRDGSFHALKCFLKDQPGRAEAYHLIADELEQVTSSYLAHIRFLERELFVDTGNGGAEYPVLVMDWVEGLTLDNYLRAHLSDPHALHLLAYQFGRLAAWLLTQPFAHGDLKPDNILVRPDGTLVLVDYDGMFVPAMQGQRAPEMGSPDFRHPDRTDADFSEHIDDFALASILLSLRAVAHCPDYLGRYGAADRLLLSEADYRSPERCAFLRQEFPSTSAELDRVYALFLLALRQKTLAQVSFRLFNLAKPTAPPPPVVVNTAEANDDEIANGIKDEYGVVYSPDGTELLKCTNRNLVSYQVKEGCKVIRGSAFSWCMNLTAITLPAGLTHIGDWAFLECEELTAITLPATLTHIGDGAFSSTGIRSVVNHSPHFAFQDGCLIDVQGKRLIAFLSDKAVVTLPASLTHIGNRAFIGCQNLTAITLPATLTHIGDSAFACCENLTAIPLPAGLTHIGVDAFYGCENLIAITLPASLTHIGDGAFSWTGIRSVVNHSPHFSFQDGCLIDVQGKRLIAFLSDKAVVTLPASLTHIGNRAFIWCKNLTAITLPATLTHLGDWAFGECEKLTAITLPANLTHIGGNAFEYCRNLTAITLPASLTHIGNRAFEGCKNLTAITLPDTLTHIGDGAFYGCGLTAITLPAGLTHIGDSAFSGTGIRSVVNHSPHFAFQDGCLIDVQGKRLIAFLSDEEEVILPAGLTHIGDSAFNGCENLTAITLSAGLTHIGDSAFENCNNLTAITLPAGLTHIGASAFWWCKNLTAITLPAGLTHIGDGAFLGCENLTAIHIPQGMKEHFKALLPSDLHSKLIEPDEDLPF